MMRGRQARALPWTRERADGPFDPIDGWGSGGGNPDPSTTLAAPCRPPTHYPGSKGRRPLAGSRGGALALHRRLALMAAYLVRRLLLVIPTLFGIIAINFVVVQFAPGGPVEQMIAELKGHGAGATGRMTGAGAAEAMPAGDGSYRGARGLDPHVIADIKKMFGFDKPAPERFVLMLRGYLRFDFGRSFFRDKPVLRADRGEDAGLGLARAVVDAAGLLHLDSSRHRQGGARRQPLRRGHQRRGAGRLRGAGIPVRHPAGRAVRRRQLRAMVSDARAAQHGDRDTGACRLASSIISGTWCCRPWRSWSAVSPALPC